MVASLVLLISALPMGAIAAIIRLTSAGPALFRQRRVGQNGRQFLLLKFRTMVDRPSKDQGSGLTRGGDPRVTRFGRLLRKFKLDEFPQFYNVLRGDMSLVGPRPKLPQYAAILNMPYRPGVTGLSSIVFRSEEQILRCIPAEQVDQFYSDHIKPVKAQLDVCYMCKATFESDLQIVTATALACVKGRAHHYEQLTRRLVPSLSSSEVSPN